MKRSDKSLSRKWIEEVWRSNDLIKPVGSTVLKRIPKIVERHEELVDDRAPIVRLLTSIRITPKLNLKGLHGVEVKGNLKF